MKDNENKLNKWGTITTPHNTVYEIIAPFGMLRFIY